MSIPNYPNIMAHIRSEVIQVRVQELANAVATETKYTVQHGPFKGMVLPEQASWGSGDVLPKLLGTYEQELQPVIEKAISRAPEVVFNVGCAEGYYAVGLARRLPKAPVYAFDTDINARKVCHEAIIANHVNRAAIKDAFSRAYVEPRKYLLPSLMVIDVEGAELEILESETVTALNKADLIIECHDFKDPEITKTLQERFAATHDIEIVYQGPRNPWGVPMLEKLGDFDKLLCVCEFRPSNMHWLVAWSRELRP